jgi:putative DNA primase/helicase
MRRRYPEARIIIAADNDIKPGEPNTGKEAAEKAAKAVSGWVALPQYEEKADWNDCHQQKGWKPLQQHLMIRCTSRRAKK